MNLAVAHVSYVQDRRLMPKFVLKDMEGLYIEEMNAAINLLKVITIFLHDIPTLGYYSKL